MDLETLDVNCREGVWAYKSISHWQIWWFIPIYREIFFQKWWFYSNMSYYREMTSDLLYLFLQFNSLHLHSLSVKGQTTSDTPLPHLCKMKLIALVKKLFKDEGYLKKKIGFQFLPNLLCSPLSEWQNKSSSNTRHIEVQVHVHVLFISYICITKLCWFLISM